MQQVKFFNGEEDNSKSIEAEINAWLKETKARIVHIFGNIAPQTPVNSARSTPIPGADPGSQRRFGSSDLFIAVVYEV